MASFIQIGDLPPEILKCSTPEASENQDSGESHDDHHSQSSSQNQEAPADEATYIRPPLSAQLRFSLTKNPPIRRTSLGAAAFSRTRPPPPAAVNRRRSNVAVPLNWSSDNRLGILGTYLAKQSLLPKMYKRLVLYRAFRSFAGINITPVLKDANVEVLGTPVDYWLTFPLQLPEFGAVQLLEGIQVTQNQEPTTVCSTGPFKSTRNTLNRHPGGTGPPPIGGRPFPWVSNSTASNMYSYTTLVKRGIKKITSFVECPKCNNFWGVTHGLDMILAASLYIAKIREDITLYGDQALRISEFKCRCDGKENRVRPFISDDYRKINWMCLLLGLGLGYCRMDQLIYYCEKRKLEIPADDMIRILLSICSDLQEQLRRHEPYSPPSFM